MKDVSIRYLKGVGPSREQAFNRAGVYTIKDLLSYFPFRYEDRTKVKKINELIVGDHSLVKGTIRSTNLKQFPYFMRKRRVKSVFEAILEDPTGNVRLCWFNQGYLADTIKNGDELVIYGKLYLSKKGLQIVSPEFEHVDNQDSLGVGRIIGVYRLTKEFSQRFMRNIAHNALKNYRGEYFDPLPFDIRKKLNFPNIVTSLEEIHFPTSWDNIQRARERFIFEELFFAQILVYLRKAKHRQQLSYPCKMIDEVIKKIRSNFPFDLTQAQEKVLRDITEDLQNKYPMQRLLQGDVGCGKTIVAALAIGLCVENNMQVAFLVPTEVLANQHFETLKQVLKGLPFLKDSKSFEQIKVVTSSLPKKETAGIYEDLASNKIKVIIGTHALIQEGVVFKNLGLVIIDEQHKFGVAQRSLLPKKGTLTPHCLVMSATPIPRSLALSLYGDLDLSVIKDLPKGRIKPQTIWVKEKKRKWVYEFLKKEIDKGRQAYVVYPVIEESIDEDLKSLKVMHKSLQREFPAVCVKEFHGKMKSQDKIRVIREFRQGEINILVCTTVVEVGVNIENATVMVVENPERFGLAQLHQLRGRIQRSDHQPHFILLSKERLMAASSKRLEIISKEASGFKIAEEDLLMRGPGDFFGNLQHGLPDLKIANPLRDLATLKEARHFAYNNIKNDPGLKNKANECIRKHLEIIYKCDMDSLVS